MHPLGTGIQLALALARTRGVCVCAPQEPGVRKYAPGKNATLDKRTTPTLLSENRMRAPGVQFLFRPAACRKRVTVNATTMRKTHTKTTRSLGTLFSSDTLLYVDVANNQMPSRSLRVHARSARIFPPRLPASTSFRATDDRVSGSDAPRHVSEWW